MMFVFAAPVLVCAVLVLLLLASGRRSGDDQLPQGFLRRLIAGKKRDQGKQSAMDARIIRLAATNSGTLTLSDVVLETGMNLKDAEKYMDGLVANSHAQLSLTGQDRFVYDFPDLMTLADPNSTTDQTD